MTEQLIRLPARMPVKIRLGSNTGTCSLADGMRSLGPQKTLDGNTYC